MPTLPRAVLFQHDLSVSAGGLEAALVTAGFRIERRFREVLAGDSDAELVVILGGFMGAYEADRYPFLRDELGLLERRLATPRLPGPACTPTRWAWSSGSGRWH